MDYNQINTLLEKYWEGETSLAEEKQLKSYFRQSNIADEHRELMPLFGWIEVEEEKLLSDKFDQDLLAKLDKPQPAKRRSWVFYLSRVAAVGALLFSIWFLYNDSTFSNDPLAEYTEEEILEAKLAYQQVKEALVLMSSKMNKGTDSAKEGLHHFDRATDAVRQK